MSDIEFITMAAAFGLVFGSFLNVCITRLPLGESIVTPGSHCRRCRAPIHWEDNIPLLSWFLLQGRCRICSVEIPWRYPAVELGLAVLWVMCAIHFGPTLAGLRAAVLCFMLLGLMVTDLETLLLPNLMTIPGLILGVALFTLQSNDRWQAFKLSLEGAAVGGGVLLLIAGAYYLVRRKQGMGLGDVKLLAMIGAFLGPLPVLLTFLIGTIATALAALVWLAMRRNPLKWMQQPMPYGTFLSAAGIYGLFWGQKTIEWYLGIAPTGH